MTTVIAVLVGIIFLSALGQSAIEKFQLFRWGISIALYGTFFYSYPLQNVAKWWINAPIEKHQWFFFNAIFQLAKMFLTLFMALFVFISMGILNTAFHQSAQELSHQQLTNQQTSSSQNPFNKSHGIQRTLLSGAPGQSIANDLETIVSENLLDELKSTPFISFVISLITLLIVFIFNVDPYGPFRGGLFNVTKESFWIWASNLVRKRRYLFSKKYGPLILALVLLVSFFYLYYSKALVVATMNCFIWVLLLLTYDKYFSFKRKTLYLCTSLMLVYTFVLWKFLLIYSSNRIENVKSIGLELIEYEFQGMTYTKRDLNTFSEYLNSPDISDKDIDRLAELTTNFDESQAHQLHGKQSGLFQSEHLTPHNLPLGPLKNQCLNKKQPSSFYACLNLIPNQLLTLEFTDLVLDKIWQLEITEKSKSNYNSKKESFHRPISLHYLNLSKAYLKRLMSNKSDFREILKPDQINAYLISSNPFKLFAAIQFMKIKPDFYFSHYKFDVQEQLHFYPEIAQAWSELLSEQSCIPVNIEDARQLGKSRIPASSCPVAIKYWDIHQSQLDL